MTRQAMIEALDTRRMFSVVLNDFTNWSRFFPPSNAALSGDNNYDGIVNADDFSVLASNFGTPTSGGPIFESGDLNHDGRLDLADFDYIKSRPHIFINGSYIAASAGFGDANFDGRIDKLDVRTLGASFNRFGLWANGDFNLNGTVTLNDFALAAANAATK